MHPMLNIAMQAARNASKIILRFIEHLDNIKIDNKSRHDFVTEVDRLSEQEIIKTIHKAYPNHAILAEESGAREGSEYCWIIDPLDGTTNYIHGFPQYAISIAVKIRDRLEVAAIYDPIRNEMFTATRGAGAQLNHHRLRVSRCQHLDHALLGTGFPFLRKDELKAYLATFEAIFERAVDVRRAGAAALDLAYVASGRLDGFWEYGLNPWDIAAGVLIIRESGGLVGDITGHYSQTSYPESGNIIAGNAKIFHQLVQCINKNTR